MVQGGRFTAWEQVQDGLPSPLSAIDSLPLSGLFACAANRWTDRRYFSYRDVSLTYGETAPLIRALAASLQKLGVRPGDRVGLCMASHPAYMVAVNAIWLIGATGVGMNPIYSPVMLDHIVGDAGARIILATDAANSIERVRALAQRHDARLVVFRHDATDLIEAAAGAPSRGANAEGDLAAIDLLGEAQPPVPVAIDASRDLAMLQYTGGTTGDPKGVMLTHANLCSSCVQQRTKFPSMRPGREVAFVGMPFSHIGSLLAGLIYPTSIGAEVVMMDRFTAAEGLALIIDAGVTYIPGSPTLLIALLGAEGAAQADWSALRHVFSAAAPTPVEVKRAFTAMTRCVVRSCYGSTETGPGIAMQGEDEDHLEENASTGQPFPLTRLSLRDPQNPDLETPLGEIGEICVAGPQVMAGYWGRPDVTAQSFVGDYFKTGDLGYLDEIGRLHLIDRLKDVINVSGYKVYPRLIEEAVYRHPSIEEAVVIGIEDAYRGETVKLFAVLKTGSVLDFEQLKLFLADKLSPMEMPKHFEVRTELPKTAVGKLSRRDLREQLAQKA